MGMLKRVGASLVGRDSAMARPYLASFRPFKKTFREMHVTGMRSIEDATKSEALAVLPEAQGVCHPPLRFDSPRSLRQPPVRFPKVNAVLLRDVWVEGASSYPYAETSDCLYVDGIFLDSLSYATYASGHLVAHGRRQALLRRRPHPTRIPQGIFLGGNGSFNYYHMLVEICAKLQMLRLLPKKTMAHPLLVSKRVANTLSFSDLLKILAPTRQVVYLEEKTSYFLEEGIFLDPLVTAPFNLRDGHEFSPEYFITRPEAVHYLRDTVLPEVGRMVLRQWPERIFLARGKQRPYNQAELIAIAERFRFTVVYPEQHSLSMQAGLFANARVIIGPTGAAWSNLVFASRGCRALCWMPAHYRGFATFSNIAGILGVDLRYLMYDCSVRYPNELHRQPYTIPGPQFQTALDSILNN